MLTSYSFENWRPSRAGLTGGREPSRDATSTMGDRQFVGNTLNWRLGSADGRSGNCFDAFARALRIGDPALIEVIGAGCHASCAFARIDHAGVAAMNQFEEVVLRLHVAPRISDQRLRQARILNSIVFLAAFAKRATVEADDRGVAKVGVDAIEILRHWRRPHSSCWPRPLLWP